MPSSQEEGQPTCQDASCRLFFSATAAGKGLQKTDVAGSFRAPSVCQASSCQRKLRRRGFCMCATLLLGALYLYSLNGAPSVYLPVACHFGRQGPAYAQRYMQTCTSEQMLWFCSQAKRLTADSASFAPREDTSTRAGAAMCCAADAGSHTHRNVKWTCYAKCVQFIN